MGATGAFAVDSGRAAGRDLCIGEGRRGILISDARLAEFAMLERREMAGWSEGNAKRATNRGRV